MFTRSYQLFGTARVFCAFYFFLAPFVCEAQWSFQTGFSISTPYGAGNLSYGCFCTADTGIYANRYYLSPTSGTYTEDGSTFDGGMNWTIISAGNGASYVRDLACETVKGKNVAFKIVSVPTGAYMVNATINGGVSWLSRGQPRPFDDFIGVDENNYFLVAGRTVKRYNYSVDTFDAWTVDSFLTHDPEVIYFTDTLHGYLISSDSVSSRKHLVFKTDNGGLDWSMVYSDTTKDFNCMVFTSPLSGYLAGKNGQIIRTRDGGMNWQDVSLGFIANIKTIDFFNDSVGVIAENGGFAMTTTNGGLSWNLENTGFTTSISKVQCFRDSIIYASTNNMVYRRDLNAVGVPQLYRTERELNISPNPVTDRMVITTSKVFQDATLTFYNLAGQPVRKLPNQSGRSVLVHRDGMPNGAYFITLSNENEIIATGKIILLD